MGLRLTLRPDERVIINGCVLRNGPRRQVFEIENRADVLRGDEMLDEDNARTPARRLAYQLQIVLVSPPHRRGYLPVIEVALRELAEALPRFADEITQAEQGVREENYFAAFRALAPVIAHEDRLFAYLEENAS